ncbi:MAG: 4-demethylwyosine synthase TYW1 [archaeon]
MEEFFKILQKQHYKLIGKAGAVKLCTWTKKSLREKGICYKQAFYGIKSHRCLQMTPYLFCNQRCVFCWRVWEFEKPELPTLYSEPEEIFEESIKAQRELLFGLKPIANPKLFEEALNPNQVAISLDGEPTLYPHLPDLIEIYKKNGFTTFVVTNGQNPEMLERINPTQLYVSLDSTSEEMYKKVNRPILGASFNKLMESLTMLSSLKTRTVVRITLIKGVNADVDGYVKILEKAQPDFVEIKSYMAVGFSRNRLGMDFMLSHEEIKNFSKIISERTGFKIMNEQPISRVVLLSSGKKPTKIQI